MSPPTSERAVKGPAGISSDLLVASPGTGTVLWRAVSDAPARPGHLLQWLWRSDAGGCPDSSCYDKVNGCLVGRGLMGRPPQRLLDSNKPSFVAHVETIHDVGSPLLRAARPAQRL